MTAAYLQSLGQLTPSHFTRGLRLFPDDAELLFQAGCLHESLAESRVQEAMQTAAIPSDVKFEIASRRTELRDAESLFRKALKVQPDRLEERIRLERASWGFAASTRKPKALLRKPWPTRRNRCCSTRSFFSAPRRGAREIATRPAISTGAQPCFIPTRKSRGWR